MKKFWIAGLPVLAVLAIAVCSRGPLCARVTDASAAHLTVEFCDPGSSSADEENCAKCKKPVKHIQRIEFFRPADKKVLWQIDTPDPMKAPKIGKIVYGEKPEGFRGQPAEPIAPGDVIVFLIDKLGRTSTTLSEIKVQ
jgi:hypothetical protein